jgi:hypothetical protein
LRTAALGAVALTLAACNSEWMASRERTLQANTTPPISYRTDIVAFMRTYLNDPRGVHDAYISEPALRTFESLDRYSVCIRFNARKSNGQYAGSKDNLVLFRDGRLDRVVELDRLPGGRDICKDAAYQPFPELQKME